jgi:predicted transcriptional regulator
MLLPCEVAVKSLVPSLRSAIAKELTQTYGFKQKEVANLLGVTQTAVSKYMRRVRGTVIEIGSIEEVQPMINEVVVLLANGGVSREELVGRFCRICEVVRRKRFMCELCKRADPSMNVQECFVCLR